MAVYHQKPRVLGVRHMFTFWVENLKRERPHLIVKKTKAPEVWYGVKEELAYLEQRNLILDEKIQGLEKTDKHIDRFTPATVEIFEMKKETMLNKQRIKELKKLSGEHKELILNYEQFQDIVTLYNKKASEAIIQGATLNLSNRLGYIQIRKIIPTIRLTGRVDWKASLDYKKELIAEGKTPKDKLNPTGHNWLVYRNQSFYLRWAWVKRYSRVCIVKNNRVYAFMPTGSSSTSNGKAKILGNKGKLVKEQLTNPLLHQKYTVVNLAGKNSTIVLNS